MKTNTELIADFLDEKRTKKGLSVYRVSKLTGISESHAQRVFSGKTKPSGELFMILCKTLEVSQKEIFLLLSQINFKKQVE